MQTQRFAQIEDIFHAARPLDPAARSAFLDQACAGDPALRTEVEHLLALRSGAQQLRSALATADSSAPTLDSSGNSANTALAARVERAGATIGRYTLLEQIGEGGFGVVFLAEQREPVQRRVALKIIKLGMDTRQVVARFEAERQALALMDHPNIAKVFDGGASDSGRPYFVMEFVAGESITKYCDQNGLTIAERLELFAQVCHAVQHAHQKGIIHRDLKPSNVLVSRSEAGAGAARVKVIDFGVAKATAMRLSEHTVFTEQGQFIGTPQYMSPEQATGSVDIDTRTDVYSLGVLLYELLTGMTPFDPQQLRSAAYAELQRIIREVEPPKPSTRISAASETLPGIAALRKIEPRRMRTLIRGELDWIVMKSLEKDRARRYATANGLASDIDRYLSGEPVLAAPPSNAYRFRKFVKRNRGAVLAGGLVAAALLIGLVGTSVGFVSAQRERDQKQAQWQRAEKAARRSHKVSDLLKSTLAGAGPFASQGKDTGLLREILEQSAESLPAQLTDDPEVEAELRSVIGRTLRDIGDTQGAVRQLSRAIALWRSSGSSANRALANDLEILGIAYNNARQADQAEPLLSEALLMRRALEGAESPGLANCVASLGLSAYLKGDLVGAETKMREALAMHRRLKQAGDDPGDTGDTLNSLAWVVLESGRPQEAVALFEAALVEHRARYKAVHPYVATTLSNLGLALCRCKRTTEAVDRLSEALRMHEQLLGPNHIDVARDRSKLATAYEELGEYDRAESLYREVLRCYLAEYGAQSPDVAACRNNLGLMFLKKGQPADGARFLQEAVDTLQAIGAGDHPHTATALLNLADALRGMGEYDRALAAARQATAIVDARLPADNPNRIAAKRRLAVAVRARVENVQSLDSNEVLLREAEELLLACYHATQESALIEPERRPHIQADTARELVRLYETWSTQAPTAGPDSRIAEWQAKLTAWQATTQPSIAR